jgi:hypothetical protein
MNIANKTLNELEGISFPIPPKDASGLVQKIYLSRNKSFSKLDAEDLRILISQKQALAFVLPKALDILKSNPFISGDYYDGDLLEAVLKQTSYILNVDELKELFNNEGIKNIAQADLDEKLKVDLLNRLNSVL